jgi:hypothetical protein
VSAEGVEDFVYGAAFFAAGIEFAVGVGSCSSFSEAVVGFGVEGVLPAYHGYVFLPVPDVFASFENDGAEAEFD